MKTFYLLFATLCLSTSLHSQFQWEHTGGPEGFSNAELYYNRDFAFLYDDVQLYRTSNGQAWEVINVALSGKVIVTEERISMYTEQNKGTGKPKEIQFLLSDDNGDSWYPASVPQDAYYNENQIMICSHGLYFKAGEKLNRSQNKGQSWKQVSYDNIDIDSVFSSNDKIFGRNEDKIFEFNAQSGKWAFSWNMPSASSFESVYIKDNNIIVLSGNRFYSSQNNGEIWSTFHASSNSPSFLIEKDNRVYALGGNLLRYTEDGGHNWKSISLDKQYQKGCLINDNFLLFSSSVGCVLFDETSILYLPANQGLFNSRIQHLWSGQNQIWAQLLSDFSIHKYDVNAGTWSSSGLPISDELFFPLYISTSGNLLYNKGVPKNILISKNQGTSWDTLNVPFNRHNDVNNYFWLGDYIYVEGNSGPYISKDFGLTWTASSKRLTSGVIFHDQVWASEDSGRLVVSPDNGLSWVSVDSELENIVSLFVAEDRIFVINLDGYSSLHSSADGIIWEYSGDGISLHSATTGRFSEKKVWKQNGIYFFQQFFNRLHYSMDNCSSWEQVNLTNYNNCDIAVLNDTLYLGRNSGGGVLKSNMPRLDRLYARGSVFHDLNGNGIKDTNENYMKDIQIVVSTAADPPKNFFTVSNVDGQFEIRPSLELNDTLWPNIFSEYIENIEPPFYIIYDSIENYDFAVRFNPNVTDADISGKFNTQAGAGRELTAHITYHNKGTAPLSGSVGLKLDPDFTFMNAVPPPSEIVSADSIVWHFEDLQIFSKNQILVEGRLSPNLQDGALISMAASIIPSNTDVEMSDNHFLIQDSVASTFIPNQKSVFPAEGMTVEEMLEGKELEYTIRFQNPFDYVVNSVQISDALASNLDYNSIRITGSSHDITKWELLPAGILRVFFDNMNLAPNSIEDERSQGFLSFAIKIRIDNNLDFNFSNKANIIFEKTRTVTTNTVSTKMLEDVISSTEEFKTESLKKLSITPNPAANNCTLSTNGNMNGSGIVRVFHPNGRVLYTQKVLDLNSEIALQTDQLMNGFYLITVEGAEGIMHGRLIVQK